ncbi:MAG: hypothetical protein RBR05_02455 [Candidatus Methanomethylophilaceae archaeon]|jgi:TPR repeat protein|nr:hypothetical protein [Candidatus Methanomethylophilaceae archaeon]MDD3068235.1 hypothetical protein [Acholeplasmataceae bacterium]MDY0224247.1 hypothetical protein [Candidatus Methanomethylophilaceae archaeon]MDY3202095.1 hypothetical protein [Methanocorpusculum sp.]
MYPSDSTTNLSDKFNNENKHDELEKQLALYSCYLDGSCGFEKNPEKGLSLIIKIAEQDNVNAQILLAALYYAGEKVRLNPEAAFYWYSKAAEQDNTTAQYKLGYFYKNGIGVDKNLQISKYWYTKAAKKGHTVSQKELGDIYKKSNNVEDLISAIYWYTKAAELGNIDAQNSLGICYANGTGVEEDAEKAVSLFTKAAKKGNADAQYNLGICYFNGFGVDKNKIRVKEWIEKSIEQNYEPALNFAENHPELNFKNTQSIVSNIYNVTGDYIQDNHGVIAKDDAIVYRTNLNNEQATTPSFCSQCGCPAITGDIFCRKCGGKLQ